MGNLTLLELQIPLSEKKDILCVAKEYMVSIEILPRNILIEDLHTLMEEQVVEVISNKDPLDFSALDENKQKLEDTLFLWTYGLNTAFDIELIVRNDEVEENPIKEIRYHTSVFGEFQDGPGSSNSSGKGRKKAAKRWTW